MKKLLSVFFALLLVLTLCQPAFSDSFEGKEEWSVTYTADGTLRSDNPDQYGTVLQPGDDVTYTLSVVNQNSETAEWYLKNSFIKSLEDGNPVASGGAYGYRLSFIRPDGTEIDLFSSDTVGGEKVSPAGVGLHEADSALKEYFFFARLESGQSGTVVLRVSFEGESLGNSYQDTLAELLISFAVAPENGDSGSVVKTGDDAPIIPLYIVMCVSGLLLLAVFVFTLFRHKKKKGGQEQ